MKKTYNKIISLIIILTLAITVTACGSDSDKIRITHKDYTEQRIIGQMLSVYLEDKGFETSVVELGGTMLCFGALKGGDVDIYVEYTGTGYGGILEQTEILSPEDTFDYIKTEYEKQYEITWLEDLGFSNSYVLSVTRETAEKYNLKTISDLIPYANEFLIGSDVEFATRTDGLPGLMETYKGLEFKDIKSMDQGLTYQAVANDDIQVNASYSTDGRVAKFDLVNLEDDLNFFPPYFAAPVLKMEFAENNPEVIQALNLLKGTWTEEDMQQYNLMVDEGADTKEVATLMLKDKGLIN